MRSGKNEDEKGVFYAGKKNTPKTAELVKC